jgi:hypothetical protein
MWSLNKCKLVFYAVGLIGIIVCFVPSAIKLADLPPGEPFSELYVLGPGHQAEGYPFNVSAGGTYLIYLGVGNHLGSSMYYGVEVKFRNASEPLPNGTVYSSLPVLYEYRLFLGDGQNWTGSLTFSFSNVVLNESESILSVGKLQVNGVEFEIDKAAAWNNVTGGFYQMVIELWRYDPASGGLSYGGVFVSLWLSMNSKS